MALVTFLLRWLQMLLTFSLSLVLRPKRTWSEKPNLPPSPPKLPIIGNLHQVGPLVHHSLRDLSKKYGSVMLLHLGSIPTLVVSSVEMAREILKTHDIAFANRLTTKASDLLFYGSTDVAFSPHGEYWMKIKKICVMEVLSTERVRSFKSVREEEVNIMIQKISRSCSMGAPINLSETILETSNNIISKCAFGQKHEGEDGKNKFGEMSRRFSKLFQTFSFGSLFPWLGWVDTLTGLVWRMKKASAELDTYIDQIIDEHLTRSRHDGDLDQRKDFVDLLLQAQKDNILEMDITRNNIKAILLDMFVAGTDTISTAIEWTIAELMKHPSIMKKAQKEVRRVVGKKSKVDEDDINHMDYLKYVIKETLRLHPPPALLPRVSLSTKTILVNGYHVPPKTNVVINTWAIQRDSEVWDRSEEFIPERFINNTTDYKGQHYEFLPFGSGRRICPGMSFSVAVIELVLANLLYWYDWKLPDGTHEELDMSEEFGLAVNKKIPLHLIPVFHFS